MKRLIFIAGIVLIIFACADLILFIIAPAIFIPIDNAPLLKGVIQLAVCRPNEVLSAQYSTYSTPGESSTNVDLACLDSQQNVRDVSQQILSAGAVGYLVPFLIGFFTAMLARPSSKAATEKKDIAAESALNSATFKYSRTQDARDHIPLDDRLRELKQAYSEGLITESEYHAKHKKLLDES